MSSRDYIMDQADQVRDGYTSVYDCEDVEAVIDELGGEDLDYHGYIVNHTNSGSRAKQSKNNDNDLTGFCCCLLLIVLAIFVILMR